MKKISKKNYLKKIRFTCGCSVFYLAVYIYILFSWIINGNFKSLLSADFGICLLQLVFIMVFVLISLTAPAIILEKIFKVNDVNPYQSYVKSQQNKH